MKHDLFIQDTITIPAHELDIRASRAGGPGGQHVNKTESKISVHWNVLTTTALPEELKIIVVQNLQSRLTHEGELIVHASNSRSQHHNREEALKHLADIVRKALYVPKARKKTAIPHSIQQTRLQHKKERSSIKKMRNKKYYDE